MSSSNEVTGNRIAAESNGFVFKYQKIFGSNLWGISPDGRFAFFGDRLFVDVVDTLYKKKTRLKFDFSAATVDGQPLISAFFVLDYCAFDMESSLVFFSDILSRHFVARGVANFEQSTVVIRQSTVISFQGELFDSRFVPKSYPANLEDGVILEVLLQKGNEYFVIKLDDQTQLQATKINWLSNRTLATVDEEFVYSLRWKFTDDESQPKKEYIELRKRSLGTGELSSYPTFNWKASAKLEFIHGCRIGNQFFGYTRNDSADNAPIVSLNLDTLEWKETGIELHGHVHKITTDGGRNLIVFTDKRDGYGYYYRFVVNKPDSLSTCVWHKLQKIINSRPDVYDFICNKLPTNIRPPRPIKNFVPLDS